MTGAAPTGHPLPLRDATDADAAELAALHVEVWRTTYGHLAPAEAIERLDEAKRLPYWQRITEATASDSGAIVAVSDDAIVGVVSFGPSSSEAFAGAVEIDHLYVRASARGTGTGRALLLAAFERLTGLGHRRAALAVVEQNEAARRFYAAMGGVEVDCFTDPGPLWRSSNVLVAWELGPT